MGLIRSSSTTLARQRRKFQHCLNLFTSEIELLHDLLDRPPPLSSRTLPNPACASAERPPRRPHTSRDILNGHSKPTIPPTFFPHPNPQPRPPTPFLRLSVVN